MQFFLEKNMNERKSNIELLRILAVYFVVVHHIIMHYVLHNFSPDYCTLWLESSILNKLTSSLFYSFGGVGVLCFFMITGYFLAEKTEWCNNVFYLWRNRLYKKIYI